MKFWCQRSPCTAIAPADAVRIQRPPRHTTLDFVQQRGYLSLYVFGLRYQNCNQWVIEMLAMALGALHSPSALSQEVAQGMPQDEAPAAAQPSARAQAQIWLRQQGYLPSTVNVGSRLLMWAGAFIPMIHSDDHPQADLAAQLYRISMPASIEGFVQASHPTAQRIEFCHNEQHIVIHRGWSPVAEGCVPAQDDQVIAFD